MSKLENHPTIRNSRARHVWINQNVVGREPLAVGKILIPESLEMPRSSCFVCQQQQISVKLHSLQRWSVSDFVRKVLKGPIGTNQPILDTCDRCIWDPDEAEDEEYRQLADQSLFDWGIRGGSILTVTDSTQGMFQCTLILYEDTSITEDSNPELFEISAKPHHATSGDPANGTTSDVDADMSDNNDTRCKKRKLDETILEADGDCTSAAGGQDDIEICLDVEVAPKTNSAGGGNEALFRKIRGMEMEDCVAIDSD